MRKAVTTILLVLAMLMPSPNASFAQPKEQIKGKTCNQLFNSCFRICARHKGEPAYQGCETDCNAGERACRSTGIWKSRDFTITAEAPAEKKKREKVKLSR